MPLRGKFEKEFSTCLSLIILHLNMFPFCLICKNYRKFIKGREWKNIFICENVIGKK